jgi:periplasmic protein TonB
MELKKNPQLDDRKKSGLFFNIGLVLSLLLVISAFEWKFVERISEVDLPKGDPFEDIIEIPITAHKVEPPKPMVVPQIIEVDDNTDIDVEEINFTFDSDEIANIEEIIWSGEPLPEEEVDVIISIAETMPAFPGGYEAFYKFVGKNLKYPPQARRISVEGKVFVHFVVDKDGSLSDIKIVRGIGAGCDEEVLRIVGMSPKWNPGLQRGNPVRVRMMLPITFRLE